MSRTITIEDGITVGALAEQLEIPVSNLVGELFKNGIMATVNERIDFDTATIIVEELGLEDVVLEKKITEASPKRTKKTSDSGQPRPPVVAVMGHVDHGKTSLLDAICDTKVTSGEAGGITQHISAYQIDYKDRKITFLDTPGHEAFAAIREHGAFLTDLVVIVVAADDGVKPQTVEAIRFANKAGVKIIVAINKIDKEGADSNRLKQQLSEHNVLVEEWGGDVVAVEVSAKTKVGIDKLLEMILLITDVEELKAEENLPASGLIIEAHMEQGRGSVAVALVESGTLRKGDFVVAGTTYAKLRNLETPGGKPLEKATPSTPVIMTGFKALPEFGNEFSVVKNEKEARTLVATNTSNLPADLSKTNIGGSELLRIMNRQSELTELNIIIKADVQGSLTSVIDSLKTLNTEEVAVRIVGSGIGSITEKDLHLASSSGAIIYGFNITTPTNIKQMAIRDKIDIRMFKVIYELIDDTKNELSKLLAPSIVKKDLGRLIVRGVFKITKTEVICGGEVTKGKLTVPALATISRGGETIAEVEVVALKRGPQETKEVLEGEMCGMSFKSTSRVDLKEGDVIELYTQEVSERTL
jgi:translation initiation factor IF-2